MRLENNGDTLEISNWMPTGVLRRIGASGFGMAPTVNRFREGAADGTRFRGQRKGGRVIKLPVAFQGESEIEIQDLMRKLVRILNPRVSLATLFVTYDDGTELFTDVVFAGGGDHIFGEGTNSLTFAEWDLTLQSTSAYFTSAESVDVKIDAGGNSGRGLIKTGSMGLSRLRVSSASVIGSVEVDNPGDADAFPIWLVEGPGHHFHADVYGAGFTYDSAVEVGNPITVNTRDKSVTDVNGSVYTGLADAPLLFAIPPGRTTINLSMQDTNGQTRVRLNFQPRYEVVI
ncbi:hypothetical protein DBR36_15820 [Microbacterium sp. HMWF026]|uniref:phage tail domain-containing protein n=1 Tax=Microbacterium sp. HMWF026 TaxID=2056861 RepID=UPI000D418394|nr:phage tail domain-containing protein [Microbacterium sp. HMWF026]PTT14640.1 hypothetical protein DBR36_15820 [Microbacterium sp. HMWF026]